MFVIGNAEKNLKLHFPSLLNNYSEWKKYNPRGSMQKLQLQKDWHFVLLVTIFFQPKKLLLVCVVLPLYWPMSVWNLIFLHNLLWKEITFNVGNKIVEIVFEKILLPILTKVFDFSDPTERDLPMKNEKLVNSYVPVYAPSNLKWYKKNRTLSMIK